jgi:hypothetical protein
MSVMRDIHVHTQKCHYALRPWLFAVTPLHPHTPTYRHTLTHTHTPTHTYLFHVLVVVRCVPPRSAPHSHGPKRSPHPNRFKNDFIHGEDRKAFDVELNGGEVVCVVCVVCVCVCVHGGGGHQGGWYADGGWVARCSSNRARPVQRGGMWVNVGGNVRVYVKDGVWCVSEC